MNDARAMMIAAGLPRNLWAEAVHHDVWLRNRAPTRALPGSKTPHEVATGEKPDLSQLCEWGMTVWVTRLDAGKLDPRAEEARFVGLDKESKGFRIYWPKKYKVSVERDVYFDKNRALEPDEVSIEGVEDVFTNSDTSQPSDTSQNVPHMPSKGPEPENVENPIENPSIINSEVTKTTQSSEVTETTQSAPIPPPHESIARRNSLEGLTPVDQAEYGRGKRVRVASSRASATVSEIVDGAFMVEDNESLEPGGVEVDINEAEWFHEAMESAMIASEDEPSMEEALKGTCICQNFAPQTC